MDRKQYLTISWFFLALMIFLRIIHTRTSLPEVWNWAMASETILPYHIYTYIKDAIFSVMIYLSFPLFILFQILGWLEKERDVDTLIGKDIRGLLKTQGKRKKNE